MGNQAGLKQTLAHMNKGCCVIQPRKRQGWLVGSSLLLTLLDTHLSRPLTPESIRGCVPRDAIEVTVLGNILLHIQVPGFLKVKKKKGSVTAAVLKGWWIVSFPPSSDSSQGDSACHSGRSMLLASTSTLFICSFVCVHSKLITGSKNVWMIIKPRDYMTNCPLPIKQAALWVNMIHLLAASKSTQFGSDLWIDRKQLPG